jgi:release factor glutamine methyltransferase
MSEFHRLPTRDNQPSRLWKDQNDAAEVRAKNAPTAQMPCLDHVTLDDFEHVYEPAADTFLLIDALQYEIAKGTFDSISSPLTVLEIGCGSGVPSIFFRQEWKRQKKASSILSFVTDINPLALSSTIRTAYANGIQLTDRFEAIQCHLASPLLHHLHNSVDIILFNPPYVPTPDEEVGSNGIEASWAGGTDGRQVIDQALPQIASLLRRPTGLAYMITVDENRPESLAQELRSKYELECQPLLRRRAHNERLTVQRISWAKQQL